MSDENEEKLHQRIDRLSKIDTFSKYVEGILKTIERKIRFINWMIAMSIATMGFFLSLLLQIKLQTNIPFKCTAITAIIFIFLAIIIGIYVRFRLGRDEFILNFELFSFTMSIILEKISVIEQKMMSLVDSILKNKNKYKYKYEIIVQTVLFLVSTFLVILYFMKYLF